MTKIEVTLKCGGLINSITGVIEENIEIWG